MTAINTILQRDRVTVITDTAFYDVGGYVQGFAPKAMVIPHWPGIVAMRGAIFVHALLVAKLSLRFDSLDAFADEAETFLAEFCEEHYEMLHSSEAAPGFQVTAAGWSHKRGTCRAFSIEAGDVGDLSLSDGDTFGAEAVDMHSRELVELPLNRAMILPLPSAEAMEDVGLDPRVNIAALDLHGIRRFGTQVLRAQRQVCDVLAEDEEATYAVGGRPVFLTVTKDGVTTSTGPAWPDKIGERIDPTQDLPVEPGSVPGGLNRQERRELERQKRLAGKRSAA
ncbi:hypothetical protein MKK75_17570 [Methylobacterium sp. J-030]|uniref:hypothetical protein n=1 Tax=Methylobacterium sp. J-030 TaxID=2836627 RepID=UPI001FB916BD|nr:hypothetical protein [Methylobacterium sp. J-030]MCJ2070581.1 hypothetical protein [Methylobacterium sp. J-030]